MKAILSHDLPRSRVLAVLLILCVMGLALTPFIFPGTKALNVAAKILVFIVLAASYDLLLGYTGIVSFAHTMFFGIGAYGVAIASTRMGEGWAAVLVGVGCALAASLVLSLLIGLFSLRVKAIFFAMITLAVASAFLTLASQLSTFTGGEDGLSFKVPEALQPGTEYLEEPFLGASIDGRFAAYYLLFVVALALVLLMLRIVNSPFGRVLQAIRENDFRAEAIGYRTVVYRTLSNVLAALFATCAGALLALWLRYNGPDTSLSFEIMLDILLIVVIGGMGTIYGAVIGSVLFVLAQNYLQNLMGLGAGAVEGIPVLAQLITPDRWLLWLGVLFVLAVYHFPTGIVGPLEEPLMKSNYIQCEGREIHYTEWGTEHEEVVIAWHGLARTGRDMDDLAEHLASRYRVICPDTLGRGLSQWSPDPGAEYCLGFYVKLAVSLLDQLGIAQCHWVGTSMGGAIGLLAAATSLRGRIQRLVLNDIGPKTADAAIARIRSYAGNPAAFATVGELEQYFRTIYKPYGWLSDAQWRRLTESSTRRLPDGRVTPHYDPAMVRQFSDHPDDYELWSAWDSLALPVLCLRGESSDLLLPETAEAMRQRGPRAVVVNIAGCGHAPALNVPEQFALVERFLAG